MSVVAVGLLILFVMATGAAVWAIIAQTNEKTQREEADRRARVAQAQALSSNSITQLSIDPERSILLAREAVWATKNYGEEVLPNAVEALRQALSNSRLRLRIKTDSSVEYANFSPDGQTFLTTYGDRIAGVWDVATGKLKFNLIPPGGRPTSYGGGPVAPPPAIYSPNGRLIITPNNDNIIRIWDAGSGKLLFNLSGHAGPISQAIFSPDGNQIVTASADNTVRVWETATGKQIYLLTGHTEFIASVNFSPNGQFIVTASMDGTSKIWSVNTGQLYLNLKHKTPPKNAIFSADNLNILTFSDSVQVWDTKDGNLKTIIDPGGLNNLNYVEKSFYGVSKDGCYLVIAKDTVSVWDISNGQKVFSLDGSFLNFASVSYSLDGRYIITADYYGGAITWDATTGQKLHSFVSDDVDRAAGYFNFAAYNPKNHFILTTHNNIVKLWNADETSNSIVNTMIPENITDSHFSPDGSGIVTTNKDAIAKVWDRATGHIILNLNDPLGNIKSAKYSPDGKSIVTTSSGTTARIWDAKSGQLRLTLMNPQINISSASFSTDGATIHTYDIQNLVSIWNAVTGELLWSPVNSDKFKDKFNVSSPDGYSVISSDWGRNTSVWDIRTGKHLFDLDPLDSEDPIARFSKDGQFILTNGDGAIKIWNTYTGKLYKTFKVSSEYFYDGILSEDNRLLLGIAGLTSSKVWDVESGQLRFSLDNHTQTVRTGVFSSDHHYLATTGFDNTVRIWNLETDHLNFTLNNYLDVKLIEWSPNCHFVSTLSSDGSLKIDLVNLDDLLNLANNSITRQLTTQERSQFGLDLH